MSKSKLFSKKNHDRLYFDSLCRTQKGETVLSLIYATYQAKNNCPSGKTVKENIAERLVSAYNLFKSGSGTYDGSLDKFESQYTIGHELGIWKNSNLDLTDLAIQVAENYITIRDYFDIVFLNYIQPVNGNIIHILYHLLEYMDNQSVNVVTKEKMNNIYKSIGNININADKEKESINGVYNMLIATSYFKPINSGKALEYVGKSSIKDLMNLCDITYVQKGFDVACEELNDDAYIDYLLKDNRKITSDENKTIDNASTIIGGTNIIYYGVPGVGKSYKIDELIKNTKGCVERVVFHKDYTCADFIGQILPMIDEKGTVEYKFISGPFTSILKSAIFDKNNMHYLVIEELNRGYAERIFGEIFQLLDRDDDGNSKYKITKYEIAQEIYGDKNKKIYIPSNLTILATMNTSDQNVSTIDTAFQRRWQMELIRNDISSSKHCNEKITGSNITWGAFVLTINDVILELYSDGIGSEDKRLGAYFIKENELAINKFSQKVLKYLWDDVFKMERNIIFKEEYKSLEDLIIAYEDLSSSVDRLERVFIPDIYNKMISKVVE